MKHRLTLSITLFLSLLITYHYGNSQEIIAQDDLSLEIEGKKGESILKYHTESNTATLIIIDSKKINVYDYNKNWELTNTVTKDKLDKSLSFVGATFFQTKPTLHFVNLKERKVISYKINNEEIILTDVSFDLKKTAAIISDNNKIIFLDIPKETSIINSYSFNYTGEYEKQTFDFNKVRFTDDNGEQSNLYKIIIEDSHTGNSTPGSYISTVWSDEPQLFQRAGLVSKCYFDDGLITITLDQAFSATTVLTINLKDGSRGLRQILQPALEKCPTSGAKKSNSYLAEGNIFQISGCAKSLAISIKNLERAQEINQLTESSKKPISIQLSNPKYHFNEGGTLAYLDKEINEEENLLKIMSLSNAEISTTSIAAIHDGKYWQLSIGSYTLVPHSAYAIIQAFVPGAVLILPKGYFPYSGKSKFIKTVLADETFEFVPDGEVKDDPYKSMTDFIHTLENKRPKLQSILSIENYKLLGYYEGDSYVIRKFEN